MEQTDASSTATSGPDAKRLSLWITKALFGTAAVLGLLVWAVWAFRLDIANAVGPTLVAKFFSIESAFTVVQFDTRTARIETMEIAGKVRIESVEIVFGPLGDGALPLDTVSIQGLRATVALGSDGTPVVEGLEPLLASPTDGAESSPPDGFAPPFRSLTASDIVIDAETPIGPHRLTGDVSASFPSAPSAFPMTVALDLDAPESDSALSVDAKLVTGGASVEGVVDLSLSHWAPFAPGIREASGRLAIDIGAEGGEGLAQWGNADPLSWLMTALPGDADIRWTDVILAPEALPSLSISRGGATVELGGGQLGLDLRGDIAISSDGMPEPLLAHLPEPFRDALSGAPAMVVSPDPDRPSLLLRPDVGDGWRFDTGIEAALGQGPVQLTLVPRRVSLDRAFQPLSVQLESLRLDLVRGLGLPRDVALTASTGPFEFRLDALENGVPDLEIPVRVDGALFGEVAAPVWADRVNVSAAGTLSVTDDASSVSIALAPGAWFEAIGLTGTGDVRLSPRIDVATIDRPFLVNILPEPTARGAVRLSPLTVALPKEDPPLSLAMDGRAIDIRHTAARTTLQFRPADIKELETGLGARDLGVRIEKAGADIIATIGSTGLEIDNDPILPGAVAADLAIELGSGGDIDLVKGAVSFADRRVSLDVAARLPSPDGNADIQVTSAPIDLGPGGLTTTDIVPAAYLADLPVVPDLGGRLSFDLSMSPEPDRANALVLTLDGFSMATDAVGLENVNGVLSFDPTAAPATLGEQVATGVLFAPVLGRAPLSARFAVSPDATATLDEVSLSTMGGDISLVDGNYDPATSVMTGTIRLRRLDLTMISDTLALEGVKATGLLSGLLPTRVSPDLLSVTNGAIAADGGGRLEITNPAVSQALASDNKAVQLLTDALTNFEYDALAATIDLGEDGAGLFGVSIEGANPTVLDGYPFELNVNLEMDLTQFTALQGDIMRILGAVTVPLRLLNLDQIPIFGDDNSG